jgi:signal transduction histidine kinase
MSSATGMTANNYVRDVTFWVGPETAQYLDDGRDPADLQQWVDTLYADGRASFEPQGAFDSPAALIVKRYPVTVLSMGGQVLAQSTAAPGLRPSPMTAGEEAAMDDVIAQARYGSLDPDGLYVEMEDGILFVAMPIMPRDDYDAPPRGVVTLYIEPPPLPRASLMSAGLIILVTGIALLVGVAPFAAFFGYFMARGMTRRLRVLRDATEAWSRGDFSTRPPIASQDEIGQLTLAMSTMADQIENLMASRRQLATLEERNRLARELHDTVKQQNFATLMQLRAAKILAAENRDAEVALSHLDSAEGLLKQSQQDLAELITELRPVQLDGRGLAKTLGIEVTAWSERTGITTDVTVQGERALPLALEQALFRVAQEALSNVARHSEATRVAVHLAYTPQAVTLDVSDDGRGFDAKATPAGGFGLSSMRQRMGEYGGALTIISHEGRGTTIHVEAPL